jgi:hypothetical protein
MRMNRILPKSERMVLELATEGRSMESRVKALGVSFAIALCAALVAGPGLAQENAPPADAPKGASDRDAPRGEGAGAGATKGGLGMPTGNQGTASDHAIEPVRLEVGSAGLQRRANRKTLIANAPKMPAGPSANTGIGAPFMRPGADGGAVRNAIGIVMPGGGQVPGHNAPGFVARTGIGAGVPGATAAHAGITGVGATTGNVGGVDLHRPAIPLNAVTGPPAHPAGINGTTMGHIASGPSYVGGPARDRSGINGTAVRPKH